MKILVTGGAGFVGSNIVRRGVSKGFEVRVLDNFYLGSQSNLAGLDNIEIIKASVTDANAVDKATRDVDYVFHQAAISSSQMFVPDPREGLNVNLEGFINVLHSSKQNNVKKVVYALSSSMYGHLPVPWKEDANIFDNCPNAYSFSLFTRSFFAKHYSEKGLPTLGLVYFSVYGPYEKPKGKYANIVSQFLWVMKEDKPAILYGDGSQSRDFIHVDDVVEANFLAATSNISGEIINVGTGISTSMLEIVNILNEKLKKNIPPKFVKNPIENYVYHTFADTTKAKRCLGFEAKTNLDEGIERLIDFYEHTEKCL